MRVMGRHPSLRMRLTVWSVSVLAIALFFFAISGFFGLRNYLKQSLQQSFESTARVISASFLRYIPEKGEAWAVGEIHEAYPAAKTQRLVRISEQGRIVYQTGPLYIARSPFESIPLASHPSPEGTFQHYTVDGETFLVLAKPYRTSDGRTYLIEVAGSLAIMMKTLHSLFETFLISMPLILLFAALGGHALMRRPLRPLLSLTEQADKIGRKSLGERLAVIATGDELESLASSLNHMIARLEDSLAHNRRFSADASHELRTPLTIMRCEMEEMLRCPALPAQATGNAVSALDEIARMSRIVASLMDITRLDAGGERMNFQPIDLTALAQTTIEQMRLLADASSIPLELAAPSSVIVVADPFRIKQVLVNLIDNAIKYTPDADGPAEARQVEVRIAQTATSVTIDVIDHGLGIAAEALPHVFERFYRAEESRNRAAGGVGLGLSIVRAIVTAHQGTISAYSVAGEGSRMTIEIPVRNAAASPAPPVNRNQDFRYLPHHRQAEESFLVER